MRIVVNEYPKSGGTWLVSLLGDALHLSKRDIYVNENFTLFDVSRHPWYLEGTLSIPETCVIKSHELPGSSLLDMKNSVMLHLIRDGRDVVVSKYFFESRFCVENGIYKHFDMSFTDYVPQVAREWSAYVRAWLRTSCIEVRYESLLRDPIRTLQRTIEQIGLDCSEEDVRASVEANTADKLRCSLDQTFKHNTFVRKATSGDWRNHFSADHCDAFKAEAGDLLIQLGYEEDLHW